MITSSQKTRACATKATDPHTDPTTRAKSCLLCWEALYSTDPQVRERLGGDPKVRIPPTVPKPGKASKGRLVPGLLVHPQVWYCDSAKVWKWHLHVSGLQVDYGYADEKEDAEEAVYKAIEKYKPNFQWISLAKLSTDSILLASKVPPSVKAVAGIPRSGMIPASIIATMLHLPLYEFTEEGVLAKLGHGSRGETGKFDTQGYEPIMIVDDSVYGGGAMKRARQMLNGHIKAMFAAIYVRPENKGIVDFYVQELPSPHLLEWNWANNGPYAGHAVNPIYGEGIGCDFDGIICHDEFSGGRLDSPYFVPRLHSCPMIVTGRPEVHRKVTEEWLRKYNAKWDKLIMYPGDKTPHYLEVAKFKAKVYAESYCGFFAESCPKQAEEIARLSRKPVICPIVAKVF